jgi:predicted nuclease of predicted toxin-antitoxin system
MNLSPSWVEGLARHGFEIVHWSTIGAAIAPDVEVLAWADEHEFVLITNDLDFSAILAAGAVNGPSVIQLHTQDLSVPNWGRALVPRDLHGRPYASRQTGAECLRPLYRIGDGDTLVIDTVAIDESARLERWGLRTPINFIRSSEWPAWTSTP